MFYPIAVGSIYSCVYRRATEPKPNARSVPHRISNSVWQRERVVCSTYSCLCKFYLQLPLDSSILSYPQSGVAVSDTGPGEAYSELKKTFGVLGDYSHNNFINKTTYNRGVGLHKPGTPYSFFTACYGFEGFAKTAAESGINVSDRALPVTCEIQRSQYLTDNSVGARAAKVSGDNNAVRGAMPNNAEVAVDFTGGGNFADANDFGELAATNIRYDIFAVTDMIIYITADGSVSTRI